MIINIFLHVSIVNLSFLKKCLLRTFAHFSIFKVLYLCYWGSLCISDINTLSAVISPIPCHFTLLFYFAGWKHFRSLQYHMPNAKFYFSYFNFTNQKITPQINANMIFHFLVILHIIFKPLFHWPDFSYDVAILDTDSFPKIMYLRLYFWHFVFLETIKDHITGLGKMAQRVTCLLYKPDDLRSIPRINVKVEGEKQLQKLVFWSPYAVSCVPLPSPPTSHTCAHTHKYTRILSKTLKRSLNRKCENSVCVIGLHVCYHASVMLFILAFKTFW